KSVSRMNRVDALCLGDGDDRLDVQIRPDRFATLHRSDEKRLVSLEPMQRKAIFVAVDRDGSETKFGRRPEAADGNFRAIGDEQLSHAALGMERPRVDRGRSK